jgi:hypothetical protein
MKRLEELALQCGAWNQVYGDRNFMLDEHFDIERFAELVLQECADHVMMTSDRYRKEYFAQKVLETFK